MEDKRIIDSLFRLMRNLRRRPKKVGQPPRTHMRLMRLLAREDNRTSKELADAMDIRPASLSQLLKVMEDEKVIERNKDPEDLRVTRVSLTDQGRQSLELYRQARREDDNRIEAWLSQEEREEFIRICNKLSEKLEEENHVEKKA